MLEENAIQFLNPLLTGKEVANVLHVSPSFVHKLLRAGKIPAVRIGKSVRVRAEDLSAFIDNNTSMSAYQYHHPLHSG